MYYFIKIENDDNFESPHFDRADEAIMYALDVVLDVSIDKVIEAPLFVMYQADDGSTGVCLDSRRLFQSILKGDLRDVCDEASDTDEKYIFDFMYYGWYEDARDFYGNKIEFKVYETLNAYGEEDSEGAWTTWVEEGDPIRSVFYLQEVGDCEPNFYFEWDW